MNFAIRIDNDAAAAAPGVKQGTAQVILDEEDVRVDFGALLHLTAVHRQIASAAQLPDPRPTVFLPIGVSAAVEQLGRDVVCAIGAYEGLVRIDFREPVEAQTRPAAGTPGTEGPEAASTVTLRHLILSLEDPDGFIAAVREHLTNAQRPVVPPQVGPVE